MTEIWFIRHGETDWNRAHRLQGWQDIPLNGVGQAQSLRLAERLARDAREHTIDAIYSSDLQRAQATAQPAAERLGMRLRIEPGLRERGFGVLEGLDMHTTQEVAPEAHAAWKSRQADRMLEGGEALGQFRSRILSTVKDIAERHPGQRVLAFTHGGVLDILWRQAYHVALDAPRDAQLLNVSVNRVSIDGQNWQVLEWGDVSHEKTGTTAHDLSV
jgi:probable phosphoglycerate mutase